MKEHKRMTVGDLRRAMKGLPDDAPAIVEVEINDDRDDLVQVGLRLATLEARCDEIDTLYLWGSVGEDVEEQRNENRLRVVR
jgi:hypothetical protein